MTRRKTIYNSSLLILLLTAQTCLCLSACRTKQTIEVSAPIVHRPVQEHSPDVFLVSYDAEVGKEPLLKAIEEYGCEIVYDYTGINGMALRKPEGKTLEETMHYFKTVEGAQHVEYDHIIRLTDPIKPRLEVK